MCGILGSINIKIDEESLNLIKHRGPDSSGIKNFSINQKNVFFAFRRLAIVDLTPTGNQPMASHCSRYEIIFNGEIYNHLELRKKLQGIIFKGTSDTETIVNYVSKYGIESIVDFNGIFAFSILDKKKALIYLARDPFGVKPLYIYKKGNFSMFSSEIKPILKHIPERRLNLMALAETLKLRFAPAPLTLFEGIEKIIPGTIVKIDLSNDNIQFSTHKYSKKIPNTKKISFTEALNQYEIHFENAVKRQLMSDVEVGILLSGGVDSALVAHYAQKHSGYNLKAFTIGFDNNTFANEINESIESAKYLNLDHYYKKIGFSDLLQTMNQSIKIIEEPLATTSTIPMIFLSKIVKDHVKVVLTGQGADEPLGGYKRYQLEIIRNKTPKAFHYIVNKTLSNVKLESIRRGAKTINQKGLIDRLSSGYSLFSDQEIQKLIGVREDENKYKIHLNNMIDFLEFGDEKTDLEIQLGLDLRFNLSDDLLLYTDKITMHHSIEARVPILDLELIEFIESLPIDLKIRLNQGKYIHKKLAEKVLPKTIVYRKKKGFLSPTNEWFKTHNNEIVNMLVEDNKFNSYFEIAEVKRILEQHIKGINNEKQIFLLLGIYYWLNNYID